MNVEIVCPRTDLVVSRCRHCAGRPAPLIADVPDTCSNCGGFIYVGEVIRPRTDGLYEHARHR